MTDFHSNNVHNACWQYIHKPFNQLQNQAAIATANTTKYFANTEHVIALQIQRWKGMQCNGKL